MIGSGDRHCSTSHGGRSTVGAERLQRIRQERRPGSRYASPRQLRYEVRTALSLFERQGIPHLDVTECNVEEIASLTAGKCSVGDAHQYQRRHHVDSPSDPRG